jgi:hypothetical protein
MRNLKDFKHTNPDKADSVSNVGSSLWNDQHFRQEESTENAYAPQLATTETLTQRGTVDYPRGDASDSTNSKWSEAVSDQRSFSRLKVNGPAKTISEPLVQSNICLDESVEPAKAVSDYRIIAA